MIQRWFTYDEEGEVQPGGVSGVSKNKHGPWVDYDDVHDELATLRAELEKAKAEIVKGRTELSELVAVLIPKADAHGTLGQLTQTMSIEIAAMEKALRQVVSACGLEVQPTISQDLDLIGNALRESLAAGEKAEAALAAATKDSERLGFIEDHWSAHDYETWITSVIDGDDWPLRTAIDEARALRNAIESNPE